MTAGASALETRLLLDGRWRDQRTTVFTGGVR